MHDPAPVPHPTDALLAVLVELDQALEGPVLALGLSRAASGDAVRSELRGQITDYLLPRLRRLDAPLLTVLGGSTGSGKSTITNSLARADVSPAGVLRPTTRAPVLICHPDDEAWFLAGEVLPDLPRLTGSGPAEGHVLRVRTIDTIPAGLALVDAPDIDSVEEANRELATELLAAADLWVFVTTAMRYADAVPWEFLRRAQQRGTALALVINRIPNGAAGQIVPHLESMLRAEGLDRVEVYPMEEGTLAEGRLPDATVAGLRSMVDDLALDADHRARVVRTTLEGALASLPDRVRTVLGASAEQDAAVRTLATTVDRIYGETRTALGSELSGGSLLRGEVLERWQELIGTGELMRAVQSRISWLRDRIGATLTGRAGTATEVQGEITSTLETLLVDHVDAAALQVATAWRQLPGGPAVLRGDRSLERASADFAQMVRHEIRSWQDDILDLVRSRGAGKRNVARVLAFGVNSVGVALMIVIFAQTGGITGGEVVVASGTAGVSQALLNALFGEQAVRDLATRARRLLFDRLDRLLAADAERFHARLASTVTSSEATVRLERALAAFERERRSGTA